MPTTANLLTLHHVNLCIMSTKELAIKTIKELPDSATWEDIEERIRFIAGVKKAMNSLDEERGIPIDEVEAMIEEWSSK